MINTMMEEYIGFRLSAKGPSVIRTPGLKCVIKCIAEYIQKITPRPNHIIPRYLMMARSRNPRFRNSGYLNITVNERIMYGRHRMASFGPHPKSVMEFFTVNRLLFGLHYFLFHDVIY